METDFKTLEAYKNWLITEMSLENHELTTLTVLSEFVEFTQKCKIKFSKGNLELNTKIAYIT